MEYVDFVRLAHRSLATVALIKSGAMSRGQRDAILDRARSANLCVVGSWFIPANEGLMRAFYEEHLGRPYFERLVSSVTGPHGVHAAVLAGKDAVTVWRDLLGPSDPAKAPPGTIRHDFGGQIPDNAAHGSDGMFSALKELGVLRDSYRIPNPWS